MSKDIWSPAALTDLPRLCRKYLEEMKLSTYQYAKNCDVSISEVYEVIDEKKIPRIDIAQKMIEGFGMTASDFFNTNAGERVLSPVEIEFRKAANKLSEEQLDRAISYLKYLATNPSEGE